MDGEVLVRDLRVVQIGDDAHGLTVIRVDHAGMRVDGPAVRFGYLLPIVAVVTHQMTGLRINRRSVRQCEGGVVLALLKNLDKFLEQGLKVPVFVADTPLDCVAEGCGVMLENTTYLQ